MVDSGGSDWKSIPFMITGEYASAWMGGGDAGYEERRRMFSQPWHPGMSLKFP